MEAINDSTDETAMQSEEPRKVNLFLGQFNWRMMLVRVLVNALTLIIISVLLPEIYFADRRLLNVLFLAAMLGILNAFVKPIIQFLTLPFIFATYGFVIVAINATMLMLLSLIFPERYVVDSLVWAIVGGAFMGLIASALESLFGLNLPIVPEGDQPTGHERVPTPRPNPVESLLFEGITERGNAELAAEDEEGTVAPVAAAVEPAQEGSPTMPAVLVEPQSSTDEAPGSAETVDRLTQPGDQQ